MCNDHCQWRFCQNNSTGGSCAWSASQIPALSISHVGLTFRSGLNIMHPTHLCTAILHSQHALWQLCWWDQAWIELRKVQDPRLVACLEMLRDSGKKLFVGTNSLWVSVCMLLGSGAFSAAGIIRTAMVLALSSFLCPGQLLPSCHQQEDLICSLHGTLLELLASHLACEGHPL